jgi:transposase
MKYKLGVTQRRIAFEEGVPRGSISGIIQRYEDQESARSKPRPGQPSVLTDRLKRLLFRSIEQNPFITLSQLRTEAGLTVTTKTLATWLRKEGIKHDRALRRPLLTPEAAAKRLEFARLHYRKPPSYWKRWIFSDETTIARGQGERHKWVFHQLVSQLLL